MKNLDFIKKVCTSLMLVTLITLVLMGCSGRRQSVPEPAPSFMVRPALLEANLYAGDVLAKMLDQRMPTTAGILVANLVNLDDLNSSSSLGRVSSQQIASRLSQHGFRVLEARLGANLLMDLHEGEFMLSRETAKLLTSDHDAAAILLGTYSDAGNGLFVSVRVVGLAQNTIIAAHEYFLPLTGETEHLFFYGYEQNKDEQNRTGANPNTVKIWSRHAQRQPAFKAPAQSIAPKSQAGTQATTSPQAPRATKLTPDATSAINNVAPVGSNTTMGTATNPSLPAASQAPVAGGRPIDPNAPVTPFPKKK